MMAFIHNQMTIIGNAVIDAILAHKTLDECYVQGSGQLFPSTAEPSNGLRRQAEER